MRTGDVMTRDIVMVAPDASIMQAVRLMLQHRISGLPVVDAAGRLVGIVTEGDLLRRGEIGTQRRRPRWLEILIGPGQLAADYVQASARKVHEVMTPEVQSVTEDIGLDEVVATMERHRIKRLPVLRDGKLVGLISRANLLRALASFAREVEASPASDAAIRDKIVATFKEQPWGPSGSVDVTVRNGVVQLWGSILDERVRQAALVAAENTPGVKSVEDHMVWIEPISGLVIEPEGERISGKGMLA